MSTLARAVFATELTDTSSNPAAIASSNANVTRVRYSNETCARDDVMALKPTYGVTVAAGLMLQVPSAVTAALQQQIVSPPDAQLVAVAGTDTPVAVIPTQIEPVAAVWQLAATALSVVVLPFGNIVIAAITITATRIAPPRMRRYSSEPCPLFCVIIFFLHAWLIFFVLSKLLCFLIVSLSDKRGIRRKRVVLGGKMKTTTLAGDDFRDFRFGGEGRAPRDFIKAIKKVSI